MHARAPSHHSLDCIGTLLHRQVLPCASIAATIGRERVRKRQWCVARSSRSSGSSGTAIWGSWERKGRSALAHRAQARLTRQARPRKMNAQSIERYPQPAHEREPVRAANLCSTASGGRAGGRTGRRGAAAGHHRDTDDEWSSTLASRRHSGVTHCTPKSLSASHTIDEAAQPRVRPPHGGRTRAHGCGDVPHTACHA